MFKIIENYISKMTIDDLNNFAISKSIHLSSEELDFLYKFIKKNYEALYLNPNIDLSKYSKYFSEENYNKIIELINFYKKKYPKVL